MPITEVISANKEKIDATRALGLARKSQTIIAMKGKKVVKIQTASATDDELLAVLMGPTGNLRAPTAIVGQTLLVGFNPEGYEQILGGS